MRQKDNHLIIPDLLKGMAIIWIVVFHFYKDFPEVFCVESNQLSEFVCRLMLHGALGVDIFIILSGYLLARSCSKKDFVFWVPFLKNRFIRIIPIYWFAIVLVLLLEWFIGDGGEVVNVLSVLVHFVGLHGFTPYIFDLQGAWWFITLIFQLYLLFPLAWYLNKRFPFSFVLLSALVLTVIARFIPYANIDSNYSVFAFLPDFVIGIGMAQRISKLKCSLSVLGVVYCSTALIFFVVGLYQDTTVVFSQGYGLLRPFVSFGLFLIMCYACNSLLVNYKVFVVPLSKYGKFSYAIYLFHRPLIYKWVTLTISFLPPVFSLALFVAIILPIGYVVETGATKITNYWITGKKQ